MICLDSTNIIIFISGIVFALIGIASVTLMFLALVKQNVDENEDLQSAP